MNGDPGERAVNEQFRSGIRCRRGREPGLVSQPVPPVGQFVDSVARERVR
ncbi:hypothetical protein C485_08227 [Natrinema altunense JCM 12890]|uniref:Uncharacterized protein n=1 Tax=Natrinema altunense (strain JCM 12890 / CGMCC 1.3731 / AJ2) TaxID=1227494 RepID=L9ZP00_NATA2|nr:hypothetical protein C485_08227 [Natrinema altunense JCM 12890]